MKKLTSVYGTHMLKSIEVNKCVGSFQSGRESVGDDARARWPVTVGNARNIEKMKRKIEKNHRKTIRLVADSTDILCTSVHKIIQQNLEMKKVCSKLVLKVLTPEQKKERVFIAETLLQIKVVWNWISHKKVRKRICLSSPGVELGGSKD